MQYIVAATSHVASLESIHDRLSGMDPSALVDVDTTGRLRISTQLPDAARTITPRCSA